MRVETEIELNSGKRFLVYASLSKMEGRVACEFEAVFPTDSDSQDDVTEEELDQIAEVLAYNYDDLEEDYND